MKYKKRTIKKGLTFKKKKENGTIKEKPKKMKINPIKYDSDAEKYYDRQELINT